MSPYHWCAARGPLGTAAKREGNKSTPSYVRLSSLTLVLCQFGKPDVLDFVAGIRKTSSASG